MGDRSRGRYATPAEFPRHDGTPYRELRVRRWGLGFVHRSRTILCRAVPNLSVSIRTFASLYETLLQTHMHTQQFLSPTPHNMVRSFATHGQQSTAKGSSTTVSRSDIRLIQPLESSALGLVRRWRLIGYLPIHLFPYTLTQSPLPVKLTDGKGWWGAQEAYPWIVKVVALALSPWLLMADGMATCYIHLLAEMLCWPAATDVVLDALSNTGEILPLPMGAGWRLRVWVDVRTMSPTAPSSQPPSGWCRLCHQRPCITSNPSSRSVRARVFPAGDLGYRGVRGAEG